MTKKTGRGRTIPGAPAGHTAGLAAPFSGTFAAVLRILGVLGALSVLGACSHKSRGGDGDCGNGVLDPEEACDSTDMGGQTCLSVAGHQEGTLFCTEECRLDITDCRTCGDGLVERPEECDDGNSGDGDGCSAQCQTESGWVCAGSPSQCVWTCGDGQIDASETCDDGNTIDRDGCSADCQVESGWECTGEPSQCISTCGNGEIDANEECDDSDTQDGDGCSSDCEVEPGWECQGDPSVCQPLCGNGSIAGDEECDDGNQDDGDGCNSSCGVDHGWECTGEPSSCVSVCGDGVVAVASEECDDANTVDDDGCSSTCQVEDFHACHDEPSDCPCVVFVDADPVSGTRTGASWATALATVQQGVDEAAVLQGCDVWVAEGTYHTYPNGLLIDTPTAVFGGFSGVENYRNQRDPLNNVTILDGENPNQPGSYAENVVQVDSVALMVMDGFGITGGQASAHGGGLRATASTLMVYRLNFYLNQAGSSGGGMYLSGSNARVILCNFTENTAQEGGGVFMEDSYMELENSSFLENTAYLGGGMHADTASMLLMKNTLFGNNQSSANSVGGGGGGFSAQTSDATIINCTFGANTSAYPNTGAGMRIVDTNLKMVNSIVWGPSTQFLCNPSNQCNVTYSNVSGGFTGTGNLGSDPLFENPSIHDFRVAHGSPCIDSANGNEAPPQDAVFIPRYDDPLISNTGTGTPNYADRGAFEHFP